MNLSKLHSLLICVIFGGWVVHLISGRGSDDCLKCFCSSISECNLAVGCSNNTCGPFNITMRMWLEAGKQQPAHRRQSLQECGNDLECSKATMRAYFDRHAVDCNGDQSITCEDLAWLYFLGVGRCRNSVAIVANPYYQSFANCTQHPWLRVD